MGTFLWLMLLFPGLCGLSSSVPRRFHVVKEEKTWAEAQQYCREKFTDLASIDDMTEMKKLTGIIQEEGGASAWIGLAYGSNPKWQWSLADRDFYGENGAEFRKWHQPNQPDERRGEDGVLIKKSGWWYDYFCNHPYPFICHDGTNSEHPYVLIGDKRSWRDAQRYCREHYTDLASVRNQAENDKIEALIPRNEDAWIGLFSDSWEWSDGSSSSFRHWAHGQPSSQHEKCVEVYSSGLWNDKHCAISLNFVCYEDLPTIEVVSPQSPFYPGDTVTMRCVKPPDTDWLFSWLKDSREVPDETSQTITTTLPEEAGQYQCCIQRDDSSVTAYISKFVSITFYDLPAATLEVDHQVSPPGPHFSGDVVILKCNVIQFEDWHQYAWLKDNSTVTGEISQIITITLPQGAGHYQCYRQREDGSKTSSLSNYVSVTSKDLPAATLEVVSPPGPHFSGDVVTLKCNVIQFEDWHQYVWLKDNSTVTDEISQTITITLPQGAGHYQCYGRRQGRPNQSSPSGPVDMRNEDNLVLVPENKTWLEALEHCRQHHVDLVSVTSEKIQRWVEGWAKGASSPHVWLGLRYECSFGFWFWVSGYSVCYDNWAPNAESEHCYETSGGAVGRDGGKWLSLGENEKLNFICTTKE